MSNIFYRYRPLSRLLGEKDKHGVRQGRSELKDLKIFFASPAQLNDPLEGYKEIFWEGDQVVWENLFRGYVLSLLNTMIEFEAVDEASTITDKVSARTYLSDFPIEGLKLAIPICEEILSNDFLREFIEFISIKKIRMDRLELLTHLRNFHLWILSVVAAHIELYRPDYHNLFSTFSKYNLITEQHYKEHAFDIMKIGDRLIFSESNAIHTETELLNYCKKYDPATFKPNRMFLIVGYSEKYLESLESLLEPKWYSASFMSDCTNSAMWGGYAENHTGACLIYRTHGTDVNSSISIKKKNGFNRQNPTYGLVPTELRKVSYDGDHVVLDFFGSLLSLPAPELNKNWLTTPEGRKSLLLERFKCLTEKQRESYWYAINTAATAKIDAWKYENEYRLILRDGFSVVTPEDQYAAYDFLNLEGVIFGIKTPTLEKVNMIRILHKHCIEQSRTEFKFYQARYDATQRKIVTILLPTITLDALIDSIN